MRKFSLMVMILVTQSVQAQWSLDLQSRAQKDDVAAMYVTPLSISLLVSFIM